MILTPTHVPDTPLVRAATSVLPPTESTPSFAISSANKSYKHQYANIYFVRLRLLRSFVEENAQRLWKEVAGDPVFVPRVLEVQKGQLCYIVGTVYMDMPMKPNVLDDIARDHSIPAPPPQEKYCSEDDSVMLEDESGRIRLVGDQLKSARVVTGVIMGALGLETANGDFEVVDFCFAGMPPQSSAEDQDMDDSEGSDSDEWIAVVSGLDVGALDPPDAQLQMLSEYLTGEACGFDEQSGAARISRLIIAGNSLAPAVAEIQEPEKKPRRGQEAPTFSTHPLRVLSTHLTDIAHSIPIHLLPGATDPSGTIIPQQSLPRAMFGTAASYASFSCETNPAYIRVGAFEDASTSSKANGKASSSKPKSSSSTPPRTLLVHSGQPLDDMFRYLPSPPATRLALVEATLRWRHIAPTAPDTLWCHPFFTTDPFVLAAAPDVYVVGNQPAFKTRLVRAARGEGPARTRIVLVPPFKTTGTVVLVNLRTLGVRTVSFAVHGMSSGGGASAHETGAPAS
ncbi:DNA polymerase subunit delta-2 [Phanerochaete sordida]|uniref:DNA-directed DNA polymerase n=1 Tax=Phanerochaete sordida TaxID=48140 RepID=A0A9P3G230_9APHY|nr:DNA polymerase subunit delta-2 [Phanerochaete sordida]